MTTKPMLSVERELLPCPFCGSAASLEDHRLVWCVRCTKCSACVLGDRAPEPHGDGVSSDEVQDAQAAAMSENTDWAAYEKSAVDAWNLRSETGIKRQVEPAAWEACGQLFKTVMGARNYAGSLPITPLYSARPAPTPMAEPVAWLAKCKDDETLEFTDPYEKAKNPKHWTDGFPVYAGPPEIKLHPIKPAAQHHGEPVAWMFRWDYDHGNGWCRNAVRFVESMEHVEHEDKSTWRDITPLYAEQPEPIAVVMPQFDMQMVMMCLGGVRGAVLTSNQCHALAQMLNACSAEVARLNGVKP